MPPVSAKDEGFGSPAAPGHAGPYPAGPRSARQRTSSLRGSIASRRQAEVSSGGGPAPAVGLRDYLAPSSGQVRRGSASSSSDTSSSSASAASWASSHSVDSSQSSASASTLDTSTASGPVNTAARYASYLSGSPTKEVMPLPSLRTGWLGPTVDEYSLDIGSQARSVRSRGPSNTTADPVSENTDFPRTTRWRFNSSRGLERRPSFMDLDASRLSGLPGLADLDAALGIDSALSLHSQPHTAYHEPLSNVSATSYDLSSDHRVAKRTASYGRSRPTSRSPRRVKQESDVLDRLAEAEQAEATAARIEREAFAAQIQEASRAPHLTPITSIPPNVSKATFVESLVDAACIAVNVVWKVPDLTGHDTVHGLPTPEVSPQPGDTSDPAGVIPLRYFIREVLRRSRSTCSTLQTALFYIHKSREAIKARVIAAEEARVELAKLRSGSADFWAMADNAQFSLDASVLSLSIDKADRKSPSAIAAMLIAKTKDPVVCGRRMFLASLICASKLLQDRTYSNRAWAKISSLPVQEINANEKAFLEILDYNLFVNADLFKNWTRRLQELADKQARKAALELTQTGGSTLPRPSLSSLTRDGLGRSQSEYLPAPEATLELPKPKVPESFGPGALPPTPVTPNTRPLYATPLKALPAHLMAGNSLSLHRSLTDPRLDLGAPDRRIAPLGSSYLSSSLGARNLRRHASKLSLPPMSLSKTPLPAGSPHLPPLDTATFARSGLGGLGSHNDPTLQDPALSMPYSLPRPVLTSHPSLTSSAFHSSLAADETWPPRPSLTRRPSGACGRLHPSGLIDGIDWGMREDRMVS